MRALFLIPAQLLASMCAGGLVSCMFPGDIAQTNTKLGGGTSIAQGLFIEAFMTAELMFVILMLAAEKSKDTFIAPVGIGLALFVAMMGGECYDFSHLSPAVSVLQATLSMADGFVADRRVQHGWLPKSCQIVWVCRRVYKFPKIPLDILVRAVPGKRHCGGILQICQVDALRGGEPGPGR